MLVAGIDLSSHAIDIVLINQDGTGPLEVHHYDLGKKGLAFDRARLVRDRMPDRYAPIWRNVIAAGIEEPQGKGRISTSAGVRIQGAVLACLPPDLLVEEWLPSRWKKAVGLPGNAQKADVMAWAARRENLERRSWGYSQDVADALGIAVATIGVLVEATT